MVSISTVRLDGAVRDAEPLLREEKHVVPQPRLEMAFHLRQIEVGAGAAVEQALALWKK